VIIGKRSGDVVVNCWFGISSFAVASRSVELGKAAKQQLEDLTGSSRISLYKVDLCSFDDIRGFVEQMKMKFAKGEIDVLIS
jgi:hypothetical protein